MDRRRFILSSIAGIAATMVRSDVAKSQQGQGKSTVSIGDSSNLFAMDQGAAQSVRRPPKPGATPSMTDAKRDELEHGLRCQCGCTLDVYTCRTTDFSCRVSPAMHSDVMALVAGGYSAQEIIDAFVGEYGERVLMAPPARGFNLFGYVAPFIALGGGAAAVFFFIRRWGGRSLAIASPASQARSTTNATTEELARLDEAMRRDE